MKGKVLAEDLHIFYEDVQEHIQQDSLALSTWINLNRDLILYSVREAKKKDINKVRPITTYYKPRRRKPHRKRKPKRTSKPTSSHTTTRPKFKRLTQQRLREHDDIDNSNSRRTNHRKVKLTEQQRDTLAGRKQTLLSDYFGDHPG